MTAFTRLLALIALLLMPFAMASAPASTPFEAHGAGSELAPGHCAGGQEADDEADLSDGCAMPCASALPAFQQSGEKRAAVAVASALAVQPAFAGIELEIATPPPKRS